MSSGISGLTVGEGVAVGSIAVAIMGVVIAWINSKSTGTCMQHSMVSQQLENLSDWMEKIEGEVKELRKFLLERLGKCE